MNKITMKHVGILFMIIALPVGYNFWGYVVWKFLGDNPWYATDQYGILIGVGIMEIFLTGLSLFIIGSIREEIKKRK